MGGKNAEVERSTNPAWGAIAAARIPGPFEGASADGALDPPFEQTAAAAVLVKVAVNINAASKAHKQDWAFKMVTRRN
jgi:hypothetical protein